MKSSTESLSPTRVKLTIEVPFEEFKPNLDKAYKTIGAQIQVPGFRKGKVPAAIIDQRVGRGAVLDEALNSALQGWYTAALQETNTTPLGQPEIDLTKFEDGETIEVTAELDVRPTLEIPDASQIEVTVQDIEVADEDVNEQLDQLRERFATFTEVDRPAAEGDSISIDLSAANKDGSLIDEAQAEGLPYVIGKATMLDGLDEAVTGLSKGESKTFSTTLVGGELKGDEVDVTVTLQDVRQTELPELDDEFAQMASDFDTMDEFRADLVERLTRGKRIEQAAEARDLVLEELVSKIEAPMPEGLAEGELANRRQQMDQQLAMAGLTLEDYLNDQEDGKTVEEFESELERDVRESIVAQFVLDQLVEENEYPLDNDELSQHIMRRAQQSGEDPNSYIQHIMEHNHVPEMISEVLRGKALAALVESAKVTDKSGNAVDLKNLRADGTIGSDEDEASEEQ
ncbi:trigger factor [Aeromicrobium tamlense]|uniref:Trigger factor n=1 Tax=Aeromicrobium tamlense TaxID=375541 RepID=A0A8I0FSF4_9ACTN|nr:trigger factor [Aeromicrobium tamlense]MBD1269027.1 trigger factor [Aeromicrobium tamlense]NYI37065.1 trigger factor [Aeromicrobium tamlense]